MSILTALQDLVVPDTRQITARSRRAFIIYLRNVKDKCVLWVVYTTQRASRLVLNSTLCFFPVQVRSEDSVGEY